MSGGRIRELLLVKGDACYNGWPATDTICPGVCWMRELEKR